MSIGVVTAFETSRNGKPKIKIDNTWMFAGRCDLGGMKVGDRVEYVSEEFGTAGQNGKRPVGLQKWRPVVNEAGEPEKGSTVTDADILRSVSNVVGNACAAGTIKDLMEMRAWINAAYDAYMDMGKPVQSSGVGSNLNAQAQREPGSDDGENQEMPESFYNGLPPQKSFSGTPW